MGRRRLWKPSAGQSRPAVGNADRNALFGVRGVLTPGADMFMSLAPDKPTALTDSAAVNLNTQQRGGAYPSTLMGAFAFLRQSLWDGVDYGNHPPDKADPRLGMQIGTRSSEYEAS